MKRSGRGALAALLLAALPVITPRAWAQAAPATPAPAPSCTAAADVTPQQLHGLWHAQFEGLAQGATVLLEANAVHTDSLAGAINRNGDRALLAGDVEDGEFTLEESIDGVSITATWIGNMVEGACGNEIRGNWQAVRERVARPFVLRRQPQR